MDIHPYVIKSRSELGSKVIFSWEITKSFHSKICSNICYQQKFYLNETLNLYYIPYLVRNFQINRRNKAITKCLLNSPIIQDLILTMAVKSMQKVNQAHKLLFSLISIPLPIQARSILELQVSSYRLNIGQDQLNVALIM